MGSSWGRLEVVWEWSWGRFGVVLRSFWFWGQSWPCFWFSQRQIHGRGNIAVARFTNFWFLSGEILSEPSGAGVGTHIFGAPNPCFQPVSGPKPRLHGPPSLTRSSQLLHGPPSHGLQLNRPYPTRSWFFGYETGNLHQTPGATRAPLSALRGKMASPLTPPNRAFGIARVPDLKKSNIFSPQGKTLCW